MVGLTDNKWVFLILVNILMLIVGCFLDTVAAITILVPILLPVAAKYGVDPVHFGLIMTLNLMVGLLHPPSAWCCSCCRAWRSSPSSARPWLSCLGWCRCWSRCCSSPSYRQSRFGSRNRWGC
jgi:hypothetical protein